MLNAMPLPIGPTEIQSGLAKPEIPCKTSECRASGEDATDFAATLEAVHKNSRKAGNDVNHKGDDTAGARSTSEDEDVVHKSMDQIELSDGDLNLMAPEQAIPNKDLGLKLSAYNLEAVTASEATPMVSETESMNTAAGLQEKTIAAPNPKTPDLQEKTAVGLQEKMIAAPNPNTPDIEKQTAATLPSKTSEFVVPRQPAGVNADAQGALNDKDVAQDALLSEGPNTLKTVKGVVDPDKSGAGPQVSQSAVDQSSQASQVIEAAVPDKKTAPKVPQNALNGLTEKSTEIEDALVQPVLDEGEPQLSNKGNPAPHLNRQGTENRQAASDAPTPGKMKAEALNFETIRSHTVDDATETSKAVADRAPETPITMVNDEASPMAGRPGVLDQALAFSTSPTGEKVSMASGQTATAPTADTFSQDNFHQLVERALVTVRGGQSEARITLKPDHLGHVQMKIVTENNLVTVKIITETPVARDLIDANANQLKAELQHQGLTVENIEVSVSDERHDAYRQARQRDAFLRHMTAQGRSSREEDGEMIEHGPAQRQNHRNNAAGIDYFA